MAGSDESVFLSVVVPAYNEDARLGPTLRTIRAHLKSRINAAGTGNGPTEIIVVDDGSTDRTGAVAAEALRGRPRDRVLRRGKNRGKGFSVKEGMLAAAGRLILFTDADLSTPITELEKLLAGIRDGHDIVIGSRALPGAEIRRRQRVLRERMGKTFNLFVRGWVLKGFPDTQCGFKLFRREAARDIFSRVRLDGFSFDVEVLFLARRLGYSIGQVPVVWINSPDSKVRLVASSVSMLRDLFRIRRLHRNAGLRRSS